jgi:hypothetical protein
MHSNSCEFILFLRLNDIDFQEKLKSINEFLISGKLKNTVNLPDIIDIILVHEPVFTPRINLILSAIGTAVTGGVAVIRVILSDPYECSNTKSMLENGCSYDMHLMDNIRNALHWMGAFNYIIAVGVNA